MIGPCDACDAVADIATVFHWPLGGIRALKAPMSYKRAILATAHKLLRTIMAMLRDQQP